MFEKIGVLVLVNQSESGKFEYLIVKGKNPIKNGTLPLEKIKDIKCDYMRFSIQSEMNYFDVIPLAISNKKLAVVSVKRYIDRQTVFAEPFESRYSPVKGKKGQYLIAAMQKSDIQIISGFTNGANVIVDYIAPSEIVVANLIKKIAGANVKAIWSKNSVQTKIEIENGAINSITVNRFEAQYERANDNHDMLFLGDLYEKNDRSVIGRLNLPESLIETALKFPEIYGLIFAETDFNFTDRELLSQISSYKTGKAAIFFSVFASIFMLYAAEKNFTKYENLVKQFEQKKADLQSKDAVLKSRMPDKKEIKLLFKVSGFQRKALNELSLGKFLSWISAITPSGAKIDSIEIKPFVEKKSNMRDLIVKKTNSLKSSEFVVKLNLSLKGSYQKTKKNTLRFVKLAAENSKIKQSSFSYAQKTDTARLETTLLIDGESF